MDENGISIYDLPPEVLANLTDKEILEWATNNEELNQAMDLRTQARKDLGMDDIPEIETTGRNTEMETPLNNNFNGGVPNTTPNYSKFESFKNPGKRTSRVFSYDGRDYALLKDLKIDVNNLDKGFTGGVLVDLTDGKAYGPDYVLNKINSKLTSGDIDSAMEELNKFTEADHTLPRNEVEKLMVDRYNAEMNQPELEVETSSGDGGNQESPNNTAEETIEEKIKRLTEEESQRFERESQADFDKSMEEIEAEFNQEAERIENEFGPAKYNLDDTSLHLDSPDVKTRKQRLEKAGKRLSNNKGPNGTKKRFTGQRVANNSKRSIKKRKLSGKKFKVKGSNLKQAATNTFVNIVTDTVKETISKNADELKNFGRHPNMFEFDEFADLTDADIDFYYGNLFGMDIKTKQQMKKSWIEKRKLAKTARKSANKRKIIDNFDDYTDNFFSYTGYSSVEGQARFSPDPEVGWDEADFKNPDSYNRHRIDFEVDDDGNLNFKRYDEMDTIEIEQNKSRRIKSNIDEDDIFGWMKKHKLGLGEAINVLSTISSYKDARKQGHSVGSSMVRAAGSFVMGEMLGFWGSMGWELAKGIPKAAIKGAEVLYKENRKMNAAANQYGLGGDFQDTQQLATMRQSGLNR